MSNLLMIDLHPATINDLDLLWHRDEQPHVFESDPNDDWGWDVELTRNPDWREQLIAEIDGRSSGFIQIRIIDSIDISQSSLIFMIETEIVFCRSRLSSPIWFVWIS